MKKFIQNKLKEQKGLTLIELLAVIVILAIIAAIAVPAIGNIIENSRYSAVKSDASNALAAANIYYTENPQDNDGVKISELSSEGYLESIGKLKGDDTIANGTNGLNLTTVDPIVYSGSRSVKFTAATVQNITSDNQTGSADPAAKVIGTNATSDATD